MTEHAQVGPVEGLATRLDTGGESNTASESVPRTTT
jgi:hypothetical protein